ncbi:class I SAM-dependent methyltransferase [Agaribacterium haliotis]|uniref:class I SAM-dependent methyltransferase n=1 Tax=Agaribacterium haliotis TaxID=2013869 RepID=UPI000BB53F5A|nr:class I SAM-dependent methyltransferase [Agaribacterium haliotis]
METIDIQSLAIEPGARVLDLGCGEGRHSIACQFYFPAAHVVALDLNLGDLKRAQTKQEQFQQLNSAASSKDSLNISSYLCADAYKLPFKEHSFEHVICSEVLEHIDDYQQVLNEITRCLKPGGSLSVSVPARWPEQLCWALSKAYHQVEGGHLRIFKKNELEQAIQQRKFQKLRKHKAHALHSPYWWLRCLFWRQGEDFLLCRLYHKILVWDLLKRPLLTRSLEKLLNPVLGKSQVSYFIKHD